MLDICKARITHKHSIAKEMNAFVFTKDCFDNAARSTWDIQCLTDREIFARHSDVGDGTPRPTNRPRVKLWVAAWPADTVLHNYYHLLSDEERADAERITLESMRWRYISARILLRLALSCEVNSTIAPFAWEYRRTPFGKLKIADALPKIHFSIAHTEHVSVVVTSRNAPIGVDIEAADREINKEALAEFLSMAEYKRLQNLPKQMRMAEFVRLWTMKEAIAKTTGLGLGPDLQDYELFTKAKDMLAASAVTVNGVRVTSFEEMISGARYQLALAIKTAPSKRQRQAAGRARWRQRAPRRSCSSAIRLSRARGRG